MLQKKEGVGGGGREGGRETLSHTFSFFFDRVYCYLFIYIDVDGRKLRHIPIDDREFQEWIWL